jgi:hypothetical protein
MSDKVCSECGDTRPDDAIHFPLYQKQYTRCLACVAKRRKMAALQKEEYRARKMGKIESKAVDTLISQARQGGATVPHSAELLENLMEYFGGTAGFSSMMLKNYFDAKPGSATRTKMLELITRLVTTNAEQGGSKKPLTFWSEEELNAEIEQRLVEAAASVSFPARPALEVEHAAVAPANSQAE